MAVTRGFQGRRRERDGRLPPGQYDVGADWPVLTAEVTPNVEPQTWSLTVDGLVERETTWDWDEAHALPQSAYEGDIHCVTTWSKLGTSFEGVDVEAFLGRAGVRPEASTVLVTSASGYTTDLPLADLTGGRAWVAWSSQGRPLSADHGGPARLVVPHLYFWKSAKWVTRLTLLDHDEQGFWERNGYHHRGDPWQEQRYAGD